MKDLIEEQMKADIVVSLLGRKCWYVSCGRGVGHTFQLALGGKVPRALKLKNKEHSEEYRRFEGEYGLMVWCAWRLDGVITSSDTKAKLAYSDLKRLTGKIIRKVVVDNWNLRLDFTGGLSLSVFANNIGEDANFDGNWEVWTPKTSYSVTTKLTCEMDFNKGQ